ncbi:PAS domain-containing protein [Streptomyces benahoarensis]|uniref:histidine kinase n=1 Tax=Streptomyces benahoarensis TaxID=2595054 RepID=A0A553ZC56_9ACTN|nr:PAS domain-containing protein [Streptomyces benahoarensis]TSB18333.1 PAS domain-containing protein [Streptomyces benahoarensis]TSB38997.1 PAS domain-containing protein [Streptomyces benahoarensis]
MSSRPSRGAARLAAILDALPDALLLVNCNGTVVNANTIALETFEAPGTALVGRGLLDLLPSFDSKRIPGSMRRHDTDAEGGRTKPTRMVARRTDGTELLVEVTSANLEDGRTPYESAFEAAYADHRNGYTGNELLMLVVRDLTGTLDTETELARQQRQTEMILRAAAEGVVGVDADGKVVLVNPSAAQILGYRASELGGKELHPLMHHSRADGSPLPWEETPLADTLRSGRKHRVRGQALWAKDGRSVSVDLTTAPVRDGDQLVGAVMTFTDRRPYDALAARHTQLLAVLEQALRGPLEELTGELRTLASDPAGQLWPEANQILHHLAAGHARMTTLVDNVLSYQRLDAGAEKLRREKVSLDGVVAAGVEGAIDLIGPGRAQFAVHAPPIEAMVDAERVAQALSHLIADVAGVDSTGRMPAADAAAGQGAGGRGAVGQDSTIVVAAARRGDVVRIEVRGPYRGGDPVHAPIARGIVRQHGGLMQTHKVPGGQSAGGSAWVLELPVSADATVPAGGGPAREAQGDGTTVMPFPAQRARGTEPSAAAGSEESGGSDGAGRAVGDSAGGHRRARQDGEATDGGSGGTGAGRQGGDGAPECDGSGRRRAPQSDGAAGALPALPGGAGTGAAQLTPVGHPAQAQQAPPQGIAQQVGGRRARRALAEAPERAGQQGPGRADAAGGGRSPFALPPAAADQVPGTASAASATSSGSALPALPAVTGQSSAQAEGTGRRRARRPVANGPAQPAGAPAGPPGLEPAVNPGVPQGEWQDEPTGRRRARRAAAEERAAAAMADSEASGMFVAGPEGLVAQSSDEDAAGAGAAPGAQPQGAPGRQSEPGAPGRQAPQQGQQPVHQGKHGQHGRPEEHGPQQARPDVSQQRPAHGGGPVPPQGAGQPMPSQGPGQPVPPQGAAQPVPPQGAPVPPAEPTRAAHGSAPGAVPAEGEAPAPTGRRRGRPSPAETEAEQRPEEDGGPGPGQSHGREFSVRTLGQGVPFAQQLVDPQAAQGTPAGGTPPAGTPAAGSGRRRRLAAPQESGRGEAGAGRRQVSAPSGQGAPQPHLLDASEGRAFAVSAPDEGSEGPEPLDGPNGAVEVLGPQQPPMDDELPPEPLDNPRRLLVWPAPDVSTQQALSDRGYRPVIVNSREEVDAQIAAYPAALFVDPLTGPITRTALRSLRQAAGAAEVPVLVTAGLGQATREAAYGADPAVLLKALAPRDSEQHPPRVLLIEQNDVVAGALTASLERRGMQVARAGADSDAVAVAHQVRPNLVVMDLMQVRRRRAGIVDWLRANGLLDHTPLVVYTSADLDPEQLPRLAEGETVLFLAERSTGAEVQARIVDLLAKIGTN